jgi:hypothetical protein
VGIPVIKPREKYPYGVPFAPGSKFNVRDPMKVHHFRALNIADRSEILLKT